MPAVVGAVAVLQRSPRMPTYDIRTQMWQRQRADTPKKSEEVIDTLGAI